MFVTFHNCYPLMRSEMFFIITVECSGFVLPSFSWSPTHPCLSFSLTSCLLAVVLFPFILSLDSRVISNSHIRTLVLLCLCVNLSCHAYSWFLCSLNCCGCLKKHSGITCRSWRQSSQCSASQDADMNAAAHLLAPEHTTLATNPRESWEDTNYFSTLFIQFWS